MKAEELGAWQALLQEEFEKPYWRTLSERVDAAYAASTVYPPREALFAAFRLTPPEAVRAVILGQDPYHEPGQANGLAFSVNPGVKLPQKHALSGPRGQIAAVRRRDAAVCL